MHDIIALPLAVVCFVANLCRDNIESTPIVLAMQIQRVEMMYFANQSSINEMRVSIISVDILQEVFDKIERQH